MFYLRSLGILVFILLNSISVFANKNPEDCSNAKVVLNYKDQTSKEGLLKAFHLLTDQIVRTAFIFELPPLNPQTGERISQNETITLQFFSPFPNATPEFQEQAKKKIYEVMQELTKIKGVLVQCRQLSDAQPRMSGGF